ncbi:uncharacterized mitochondrial protein-like protein [Tanacetum coccineum]
MNSARPMTNLSKSAHSTVKWPIHKNTTFKNSNFNQRVNTVKDKKFNTARPKEVVNAARPKAVVNVVKGNNVNAVKASAFEICAKSDFARLERKERVIKKKRTLLQCSPDEWFKPSSDDEKKVDEDPRKDSKNINQEKDDNVNSTNNVNVASTNEVNVVGGKTSIELPDDLNMPALEDIAYSDNDEDVAAEADVNNLDTTIQVSPIPTTRIHKDHLVEQIIKDLNSAPQTRRMTKSLEEHDDIIFGSTKKSLCTEFEKMMRKKFKMSSMGELIFFLGLQVKQKEDEIFINQDKYMIEILKKFSFIDVKTASTPMETQKLLLKDEDVLPVVNTKSTPKDSHLHAVKRIFSDYARASLDRKFTTGGCQFLGSRLTS